MISGIVRDGKPVELRKCKITIDRVGYIWFYVLDGTRLAGWNTAFFLVSDAEFLMREYADAIGRPMTPAELEDPDEERMAAEEIYGFALGSGIYENLPNPNFEGYVDVLFCFEGGNCEYEDPEFDPDEGYDLGPVDWVPEPEPPKGLDYDKTADKLLPAGLNARDRGLWKVKNLLTADEREALFGDPYCKWWNG